jgi:class 3 adenylate cyclase
MHGGKLVKESDDRLLAAFPQGTTALRTALELQALVGTDVAENAPRAQLAMHRGMAMSTSINGRLDYFGRAVSLANRLLDSHESSFVVSHEIAQDDDCRELLTEARRTLRQLTQQGELSAYEVRRNTPAESPPHTSAHELLPSDSTAILAPAGQERVGRVSP